MQLVRRHSRNDTRRTKSMGYLTVLDPQEGRLDSAGDRALLPRTIATETAIHHGKAEWLRTEPCGLEQQQQRQPYTTGKAEWCRKEDESLPGIG